MGRTNHDDVIIRAPRRRERKAVIEATARHFEYPRGSGNWERFCRGGYLDGACYDWDASRIAVADGQIVGHVGIWGHTRRIGRARVTSGGPGAVCTLDEYRGCGIGRRLMEGVLEGMAACGYDMSFMAGIPGFYTRFGWVAAKTRSRVEIPLASLPAAPTPPAMRRAPLVRMIRAEGAIGRIYRREQADVAGAAVRPLFTRDHRHWRLTEILDTRRRVCGYVASAAATIHDVRTLVVYELGGVTTPAGRRRVLAALRHLAAADDCTAIHLPYGPDHALAPALRLLRCDFIESCHGTGGDMIRIINLPSALRKMATELTARLAPTPLARRSGELTLVLPDQSATLLIRRGRVTVAPQVRGEAPRVGGTWHTARLLVGADDSEAVIDTGGLRWAKTAKPWVQALFPKRHQQHLRADDY